MSGGTPDTQTVRNETVIDPVTQAWRQALFSEAGNLYNQGPQQYYPGSTVTPYADQTWAGLDMMQSAAEGGVPGYGQAVDTLTGQLGGVNPATAYAQDFAAGNTAGTHAMAGFLPGAENPYLDRMYTQGAERVANDVNTQFAKAGRLGSGAYTEALGDSLGNLYTSIYAPAYETERNRQMSAASQVAGNELAGIQALGGLASQDRADNLRDIALMPQLYQMGLAPSQTLLDVGVGYENLADAYLQDDIARFNYGQNAPWDALGRYASVVNGLPDFSAATTSQSVPRNTAMSGMGGAMSGGSLASMAGFGPWGVAGGALLGGLRGAYG